MERIFTNLVNIGGELVPVFPMISDNALSPHPVYAQLPLSKQVEIVARVLKRENHNQVVLLKTEIKNGLAILNIAKMFKDEGIEVVAVMCLEITKEAYDMVNPSLKYGVGDGLQYMNDLLGPDQSDRKKLH